MKWLRMVIGKIMDSGRVQLERELWMEKDGLCAAGRMSPPDFRGLRF